MQAPLLGLAKSIYYHITRKWPFELSEAIVYQKVHHIIDGSLEHTCQRHILALNTWYQYPYSPYSSLYIFFRTDKENSINNQSNLDWQSLPFILMTLKVNDSEVSPLGEIRFWSLWGFRRLIHNSKVCMLLQKKTKNILKVFK